MSSETPLKTTSFYFLMPKEKPLEGGSVSTPIVLALTYLSKAIFSDKVTKKRLLHEGDLLRCQGLRIRNICVVFIGVSMGKGPPQEVRFVVAPIRGSQSR